MPISSQMPDYIRALPRLALDALLPPRCLSCGRLVEGVGTLCSACWRDIQFLASPHCAICGLPFEYDPGPEALCGECMADSPPFDRARAVMRYDEASRRLVLGFKYRDRTDGAPAYGAWLARAGAELIDEADVIAPVPLHWARLFLRRYNQAALLAQALGRRSGVAVIADLLVRRRYTRPQARLSAPARRRNVAGAFAIKGARADSVQGRRILLVDDVYTTGATVSACARALRAGGARAVDVLVLARVTRSQ